jgi:hypothetical protein
MRNKQDASGGDNSTFNQAGGDVNLSTTNNYGMGYSEVKDLFMNLFHIHFLELGKDVENLIDERAEIAITDYLNKLVAEDPNLIQKTRDPDIRYDIIEVQKNYARFGDKEMSDLLVDVLVQRTKEEGSFTKIVLNEALTVIPKLTKLQIDILTLLYLVQTVGYVNPVYQTISTFYEDLMAPFLDDRLLPDNEYFYLHLQSCGCLAILMGVKFDLAEAFHKKFKGKYTDLETINQEIRENPQLDAFEKSWSGKAVLNRCTLSSVGLAIGLINCNLKLGSNFNMDKFIAEYLN